MRQVLTHLLNLLNSIFWLLTQNFLHSRLLKTGLLFLLFSQSLFTSSEPLDGANQTPWVSIPTALVKEDKSIVFGCSIPSESKYYKLLENFYRKIFMRLGYGFTMISLPRGREMAELMKNSLDGTCGRRKDAPHHVFSTLKRLPEPIVTLSYVLLSREPYPDIRYLNEIPSGKILAYVRGGALAQDILDKQTHINVFKVPDAEVGIKMLAGGRVDFFFGINASANRVLDSLNFQQTIYRNTIAEKREIFTYLIPSRQYLVEPMAEQMVREFKALKRDYLFEL
jgi:ABC-type amino acid transport substrate-binding protein